MTVILVEPDPFVKDIAEMDLKKVDKNQTNVRRPLAGHLHAKNKFSFISVKAVDDNGAVKDVLIENSSAPKGKGVKNYNFILSAFQYSQQEKFQVMETFGSDYIFFFGKKPTIVQAQGMLINTPDFNWRNEWYHNYENYLRGTKCVERKARVYLGLDGLIFVGYILNTSTTISQQNQRVTPFNFSMLVTNFLDTSYLKEETVITAEEGRTDKSGKFVEYLGKMEGESGYSWDESTQAWKQKNYAGNAPATLEDKRTADWISPVDSEMVPYYSANSALREIGIRQHQFDNGSNRFEAVNAYNNGNTIFSSSSEIDEDLKASLDSGVRGGAVRLT